MTEKKAIIAVSFGTSVSKALKSIEAVEKAIKDTFTDYQVFRAFTSGRIIQKIKNRDHIHIDTIEEALERVKEEGYEKVIVQPLHVLPGNEYYKVLRSVENYDTKEFTELSIGNPMLYNLEDYEKAVKALENQLPLVLEGEGIVLMGHGTDHHSHASYFCLQHFIDRAGIKGWVGTMEEYPGIQDIIPLLKYQNIKKVHLIPFMLVAGDHAIHDMAGDSEDSWKNILEKSKFEVVVYYEGLGDNEGCRKIYIDHVNQAIGK